MTGLIVLGFLLCCRACYIGAKLFYAAMQDAVDDAESKSDAAPDSDAQHLYNDVYERDLAQYNKTADERAREARAMLNMRRPKR